MYYQVKEVDCKELEQDYKMIVAGDDALKVKDVQERDGPWMKNRMTKIRKSRMKNKIPALRIKRRSERGTFFYYE
jgi:hypothetical protein